jgi:cyclase
MPKRIILTIILTHEDANYVWGNQLVPGAEIIAHRSLPERMKKVAEPKDTQQLQYGAGNVIKNFVIKVTHPGL